MLDHKSGLEENEQMWGELGRCLDYFKGAAL